MLVISIIIIPAAAMFIIAVWHVIWVVGMSVYYVWIILEFFRDSNDCKGEATEMWVGLLLIIIEAFGFLSIILVVILVLALILPVLALNARTADVYSKV